MAPDSVRQANILRSDPENKGTTKTYSIYFPDTQKNRFTNQTEMSAYGGITNYKNRLLLQPELNLFVDLGAKEENVFVYHKVYGVIKADMNIKSRRDVRQYMEGITSGKSTNLMNLTSNYHYHTIVAEDEQTLDMIQEELQQKGFFAKLQDYEPVDFWGEK